MIYFWGCDKYYEATMSGLWIGTPRAAIGFINPTTGYILYFAVDGEYLKMVKTYADHSYHSQRYVDNPCDSLSLELCIRDSENAENVWRSGSDTDNNTGNYLVLSDSVTCGKWHIFLSGLYN